MASLTLLALAGALLCRMPRALAAPAAASVALAPIPLDLVIDGPAATDDVVAAQLGALAEVYAQHGLSFHVVARRAGSPSLPQAIVTRTDRDALVSDFQPGAANVFFVTSLEDVDEADRHRFGVCWRNERDPAKRYVVIASYSSRGVLAHELGHLLGLAHTTTLDNVMSYSRSPDKPSFFTAAQAETMRRTVRGDFASGFLRRSGP
jgi:hypothetical protein